MLTKNYYLTLRIESENAVVEARYNGLPLYTIRNGSKLVTEEPVNQYSTSRNTLSLNIFNQKKKKYASAKVVLSLYLNEDGKPESSKKLVGQLSFSGADLLSGSGFQNSMPEMKIDSNSFLKSSNGDIHITKPVVSDSEYYPGGIGVSQAVEFSGPFPSWGYLEGSAINFPSNYKAYLDDMDTYNEATIRPLYEEYKKLAEMINNEEWSLIADKFLERNSEYDSALYLKKGEYESRLLAELKNDKQSKELKVEEFNFAAPSVSLDRKLMKLGANSILYFEDEENSIFSYYPIWFYQKDGKWLIGR